MKKASAVLLAVVMLLLLVSCGTNTAMPDYSSGVPEPARAPAIGEPPPDRTWISPGTVEIGNFYPGARAEWNITVHNGKDTEAQFVIQYRKPDRVEVDYSLPPEEAGNWIIVVDPAPVLAPQETRDILVALDIPKGIKNVPPQWEFWISVMDNSQTGMIVTELISRWLVKMRK